MAQQHERRDGPTGGVDVQRFAHAPEQEGQGASGQVSAGTAGSSAGVTGAPSGTAGAPAGAEGASSGAAGASPGMESASAGMASASPGAAGVSAGAVGASPGAAGASPGAVGASADAAGASASTAGDAHASVPEVVAQALAENAESIGRALQVLASMERAGSLQELAEILALIRLLKSALTDDMVIGMAQRVEGLAAVATDPVLTDLVTRLPSALRAAEADAARAATARPSVISLVRQLRDPKVYRGLAFLLSLVKHLAPEAPEARASNSV